MLCAMPDGAGVSPTSPIAIDPRPATPTSLPPTKLQLWQNPNSLTSTSKAAPAWWTSPPKKPTQRRAVATGRVIMTPDTTAAIAQGEVGKGDVLAVARVAGIQAAKRQPWLVPLCHPLLVGSVSVDFRVEGDYVEIEAAVETYERTGVRWRL